MARGTDFGGIHSHRDLNLIQQRVEVEPAEPKLNFVEVPGADGSRDLSTQPAGRVTYKDRKIIWTFALYPGDNWDTRHHQVSNALNGLECHITLDSDPGYYYQGRLAVKKYKLDNTLRQITIEATCRPYCLKQEPTVVVLSLTSSAFSKAILHNERKPAVPVFTATVATTIRWNGQTVSIAAGTYSSLDIELPAGDNVLEAQANSGTGRLTITYQEGAL